MTVSYFCRLATSALLAATPMFFNPAAAQWQSLFNGNDLEGWHGDNPHQTVKAAPEDRPAAIEKQQAEFLKHWRVENQELVNDGKGPYATTDEQFGDIEFQLSYKTVAKADSGIYLRGTPQIQIWDTTKEGGKWDRNANYGSGGLFNNRKGTAGQLPLRLADRPFGQWNQFRVVQIGSRTWVEFNHQLVVDGAIMENYWDKERKTPLPARGPIHLQTHGGEIRWKDIAVREIGHEEAISRLRGDDGRYGFQPVFNGCDLTGWAGAIGDYEVVDGSLRCKSGRGGVLFTEKEYQNFVVRLEFKLPAGGNNGLAIRYPGQGRAAYDGMCELQVLDDDHQKYAKLDARQYHGSIYGIVPAHRGYLRPAGNWNYQEVTVDGHRIRVELNGTVIVDADVSEIQEYKDDAPHPGKLLTSGHFGFAGHNDPVEFRRIAIKELPPTPVKRRNLEAGKAFEANFQDVTDANLSSGDGFLFSASSTKRQDGQQGLLDSAVTISQETGVIGHSLHFKSKPEKVLYYPGNEVGYRAKDWSGSVSVWLKLAPDKDLEPGFCDPIQITQRAWNDGALFVDFDKELPRDFRLGVFSDLSYWNPDKTPWDEVPAEKRPLVVVENPPFSSHRWTHVVFTWNDINDAHEGNATAALYLNGEFQGSISQPMKITMEPDQIATMIGVHYIGFMDELKTFNRALTPADVQALYESENPHK